MTQFPIHAPADAPQGSRETLANVGKAFGFIPNVVATMAGSPALVKAYTTMTALLEETRFTAQEQQVAILAVSYSNGCDYCMAAHTLKAQMTGVDTAVLQALRSGSTVPDERIEALRRFVQALVEKQGWVEEDDVQAFLEAGFEPAHVLDAIMIVGMKTLTTYTNHVAKTPLDRRFSAGEWQKSA